MTIDLHALRRAVAEHGRVVRVVVAQTAGSAPREPGAAMLVWANAQARMQPDASDQSGTVCQSGTIGGGAFELMATKAARLQLAGNVTRILSRHALGPELGQCCGGRVVLLSEIWDAVALSALPDSGLYARAVGANPVAQTGSDHGMKPPLAVARLLASARGQGVPMASRLVDGWMIEPVVPRRQPLWLWGAGHVGRAIAATLAPLPDFSITWIDTDAGRFPDPIPDGVLPWVAPDPVAVVPAVPADALHLIVTFSHALDLALCHALLAHGFRGAGLIGSATKWARFRSRLRDLGHSDAEILRIACPIGDPALGKHPQAIAVGVTAALLREQRVAGSVRERPGLATFG